ncbi:MAG: hypothetical protein AB7V13_21300 [Pseudorhodoplanes sp.]|uniref:hypothetical protein n=1 Tax=Pseudorhodoplanes sp. TaxID=1934341 RepID=UPI003D0F563B
MTVFRNLPIQLIVFATLAVPAVLGGCTSHDVVTTATRPGKFKFYSCDQLNRRGTDLLKREHELQTLMQRAKEGAGGDLVIAVAYRNEYNITQGDLREIEISGAEKRCSLTFRSVSERAVR